MGPCRGCLLSFRSTRSADVGQSVADSRYEYQVSDKSRLAAVMLGAILPFFGLCGVHRIYTGHVLIGILQLIHLRRVSYLADDRRRSLARRFARRRQRPTLGRLVGCYP